LKAWDILNNSNTATIEFEVVLSDVMRIDNLANYPNPFNGTTNFVFDHNQSSDPLDVEIQIFNTNGQLVRTIIANEQYSSGYRSLPIQWNGRSEMGFPVAKGLYIYRAIVKNAKGVSAEKRSKLLYY
jgi:flagellar hook assembly protein FlgD